MIIQNFRAKADTPCAIRPSRALVRPGRRAGSMDHGPRFQRAGATQSHRAFRDIPRCRDQRLGRGLPPTIDWVNPEAPWPHLDELRERTENAGFDLRPRLPVYPEYVAEDWIDEGLYADVVAAADRDGLALITETSGAR